MEKEKFDRIKNYHENLNNLDTGKPTKRYLRVKKKIDLIESCPPNMEEILLMM